MLDKNFAKLILSHILMTNEYTIEGIARYTGIHEDVIQDLASGLNTKPLAMCLRKIIELHRSVKRELYEEIRKKLIAEYLLLILQENK